MHDSATAPAATLNEADAFKRFEVVGHRSGGETEHASDLADRDLRCPKSDHQDRHACVVAQRHAHCNYGFFHHPRIVINRSGGQFGGLRAVEERFRSGIVAESGPIPSFRETGAGSAQGVGGPCQSFPTGSSRSSRRAPRVNPASGAGLSCVGGFGAFGVVLSPPVPGEKGENAFLSFSSLDSSQPTEGSRRPLLVSIDLKTA